MTISKINLPRVPNKGGALIKCTVSSETIQSMFGLGIVT